MNDTKFTFNGPVSSSQFATGKNSTQIMESKGDYKQAFDNLISQYKLTKEQKEELDRLRTFVINGATSEPLLRRFKDKVKELVDLGSVADVTTLTMAAVTVLGIR